MRKGLFVVFEGLDGCGKTTQTDRAVKRLTAIGLPVIGTKFPRYQTPTGQEILALLGGKYGPSSTLDPRFTAMKFAEDHAAAADEVRAMLSSGQNLVSDRYVTANFAYQGCKFTDSSERAEFFLWLDHLEYVEKNIPRADLNVILDVPADIAQRAAAARGKLDGNESDRAYLERTRQVYLDVAKARPDIYTVIDCTKDGAMRTIDEVHDLVWSAIRDLIKVPA